MSAIILVGLSLAAAVTATCHGVPNTHPIVTTAPVLLRTVPNGQLFSVALPGARPNLTIAHVYGTPYEMGFAQGTLLNGVIEETMAGFYAFVKAELGAFLPHWPKALQEVIEALGADGVAAALDLEILATKRYTPTRFLEEMRGLADAMGRSHAEIHRLALFPELIKAGCSMFGAWGSASVDGDLIQLRALDWNTNTPFQKHPLLLVYHPREGHAFSTLTWPGLVGAITGLNEAPLGICEKVWLAFDGEDTRFGMPWTFVLRDVLQYDSNNKQAIARIEKAKRTCSIFVGVGSGHDNTFSAMEYSYPKVTVWNATDQPVYKNHPLIQDTVWIDKHMQPDTHDACLGELLQANHGNIDAETTLRNITAVFQTGDMHIAIYSYKKPLTMHIANALPMNDQKYAAPAYNQPFVRVDMDKEFARPMPPQ